MSNWFQGFLPLPFPLPLPPLFPLPLLPPLLPLFPLPLPAEVFAAPGSAVGGTAVLTIWVAFFLGGLGVDAAGWVVGLMVTGMAVLVGTTRAEMDVETGTVVAVGGMDVADGKTRDGIADGWTTLEEAVAISVIVG